MRLYCFLTSDGELPAVLQAALPCDPVGCPAADELARVLDGGREEESAHCHVPVWTRLKLFPFQSDGYNLAFFFSFYFVIFVTPVLLPLQ